MTRGTMRKISAAAKRLDPYVGSETSVGYVGAEDVLHFNGGRGFESERETGLSFGFRLQNKTTANKVIALTPTYLGTSAALANAVGGTIDAVLNDGTINGSADAIVTGTAKDPSKTIAGLLAFIAKNPTRITEIIIKANTDAAFEEQMVLQDLNPFARASETRVNLSDYILPDQYTQTKAVIPIARDFPQFQLDDQKLITLNIGGTNVVATTGVVLDITFKVGAVYNAAGSLNLKARRAYAALGR